jgi:molybdopterin-containing oxidoreductase family iron-sulfur binding subunit
MNEALGAVGTTVFHIEPVARRPAGDGGSLSALAEDVAAGGVTHLLILGGNPVYTAPRCLAFAAMLSAVPFSVHLGLHVDETGAACRWHLPLAHALECWGDARAFDGTASLRQPARASPGRCWSPSEVLALLLGEAVAGEDIVRRYWQRQWQGEGEFATRWHVALHDGVIAGTARPLRTMTLRDDWAADAGFSPAAGPGAGADGGPGGFTLLFTPDPSVWDGRYANNGWLQELPKPLTKLVWGNAALLAPQSAEALGVSTDDVIEIELGGHSIRAPVWIAPGHAPDTLTLPLGYGRTRAGRLGDGIGFNAYHYSCALLILSDECMLVGVAYGCVYGGDARPVVVGAA